MSFLYEINPVVGTGGGLADATAEFYTAGTTTAENVYSDKALTTSLGFEVDADANGRFDPVYLADGNYRMIVKVGGAQVYEVPEIIVGDLSDLSSIETNTSNISTNTVTIGTNSTNIATNSASISTNLSHVVVLQGSQAGGGLAYTTKAELDADLAHDANQKAEVFDDSTASNNGVYTKAGASGAGSWTKLTDIGATANAANISTNTAAIATNSTNIATNAAAVAGINTNLFNANTIYKNDWWVKTRLADYAFDMSYGDGVGYNATSGALDDMVNLVDGTLIPYANASFKATETTVSGHAAAQMNGKRPYRGSLTIPDTPNRVSYHNVFKLGTAAATQRPVTVRNSADASAYVGIQHTSTKLLSVTYAATGETTKTDNNGVAVTAADGDLVIQSIYVDLDANEATYFYSGAITGAIRQAYDADAFIGKSWDHITIGGFDTGSTHVLTDAFIATAQFSGNDHTLAEFRDIHKGLLTKFIPTAFENVVLMQWLSQSNGDGNTAGSAANQVTFTDGTAYLYNSSSGLLESTGVAHPAYPASRCNNPLYWFAKELQDLAAADGLTIKPILSINTAGGVPFSSSTLWTSGSQYLGIEDEEGANAGKTSTYNTQRPSWLKLADIVEYTPKFNVLARIFVPQGFESDLNVGVPYNKAHQALADTWMGMKREFGFTHCLNIDLGMYATDASEVADTEAKAEPIRQAINDFTNAHSDAFMIYDHLKDNLPDYSVSGSFSTDDLVVDADGKWVSGAGYYGVPHWSTAQYRAVGLTGAENFWRLINGSFSSYPATDA